MDGRHVKDKMRVWRAISGLALYPGSLEKTISCAFLSTLPVGNDIAMA